MIIIVIIITIVVFLFLLIRHMLQLARKNERNF